jgi:hypothetical protein
VASRLLVALLCLIPLAAEADPCPRPWIFFDSGGPLVDLTPDKKNFRNVPGALEYLAELDARKYPLGLIVNLDDEDGDDIPAADQRTQQALFMGVYLRQYWLPGEPFFPMSYFGKFTGTGASRRFTGRAFFPTDHTKEKPATCADCVFSVARASVPEGCPAVFQGEDPDEMAAAEKVRLIPFWVGHTDKTDGFFWLREDKIAGYVKGYKPGMWKSGI